MAGVAFQKERDVVRNCELEAANALLVEALEFYGDNKNYDLSTCEVSDEKALCGSFVVMKDEGKKARSALLKYRGG
jgi:hypothetical protein